MDDGTSEADGLRHRPHGQEISMSDDVVIVGAARTPVGAFNGAFGNLPAHELGKAAIQEALEARRHRGRPRSPKSSWARSSPPRRARTRRAKPRSRAGIPVESPAWGVNQLCGSGLRAVALGYQAIMNGDFEIVVAGGQESMSMAPHAATSAHGPEDGLARNGRHDDQGRAVGCLQRLSHGNTAENVAKQYQITRGQQDEFAVASQNKAEAAQKAGKFKDEIIPVVDQVPQGRHRGRQGRISESTASRSTAIAKLRPAFDKEGSVTAANASGINDGAAAVVLMSAAQAAKEGKKPLARIVSWAHAGVDPKIMGTGPIPASRAALKKAGWSIGDLDLIEANEAFAAQACAVNKDLGWDPAKVNVNGGAIAIGHPIGASGARVLTTLLFEMGKRDAKKGLATLCIGGGMGIAMCVER